MAPTLADSLSAPPCGEECRLLVHKVTRYAFLRTLVSVYIPEILAIIIRDCYSQGNVALSFLHKELFSIATMYNCVSYYNKAATDETDTTAK